MPVGDVSADPRRRRPGGADSHPGARTERDAELSHDIDALVRGRRRHEPDLGGCAERLLAVDLLAISGGGGGGPVARWRGGRICVRQGPTWARRGHTPIVRVSGKGSGRVSVAGLVCLRAGARGRLMYRLVVHHGRRGERRSLSEADYANLIT